MKVTNEVQDGKIELVSLEGDFQECMSVACYGLPGTGKTRFCATAPGPIGVMPLDRKTRMTMLKMHEQTGVKIIVPSQDFIRHSQPLLIATIKPECGTTKVIALDEPVTPKCCAKHYYRWHLNRVKDCIFKMAKRVDIRTIIIDSGTQLWEDVLYANYGRSERIMPRDRKPANQEFIDIINGVSNKHLIITHQAKQTWKNDKPVQGVYEHDGFTRIGFYTNVIVEMKRNDKSGEFTMDVVQCQANSDLHGVEGKAKGGMDNEGNEIEGTGLRNNAITFQQLAMAVYPNSDPDFWE